MNKLKSNVIKFSIFNSLIMQEQIITKHKINKTIKSFIEKNITKIKSFINKYQIKPNINHYPLFKLSLSVSKNNKKLANQLICVAHKFLNTPGGYVSYLKINTQTSIHSRYNLLSLSYLS